MAYSRNIFTPSAARTFAEQFYHILENQDPKTQSDIIAKMFGLNLSTVGKKIKEIPEPLDDFFTSAVFREFILMRAELSDDCPTPLHLGIKHWHTRVVNRVFRKLLKIQNELEGEQQFLLDDVINVTSLSGDNLLHFIASYHSDLNESAIHNLHSLTSDEEFNRALKTESEEELTAWFTAAHKMESDKFEVFIKKANQETIDALLLIPDESGDTDLHIAADGTTNESKVLTKVASPKAIDTVLVVPNKSGMTPLHLFTTPNKCNQDFITKPSPKALNSALTIQCGGKTPVFHFFENLNFAMIIELIIKASPFVIDTQWSEEKQSQALKDAVDGNDKLSPDEKTIVKNLLKEFHSFIHDPEHSIQDNSEAFIGFIMNYLKPENWDSTDRDKWITLLERAHQACSNKKTQDILASLRAILKKEPEGDQIKQDIQDFEKIINNNQQKVISKKEIFFLFGRAWSNSNFFPPNVKEIIQDYVVDDFDVRESILIAWENFSQFSRTAVPAFYAFKIGTHAVCGRRTQALELAKQHPKSMAYVTQVSDLCERLVQGTPLRLAAAALDYMLVSDLRKLLDEKKAAAELKEQFPSGWEKETKERMSHYLEPLKQFADRLVVKLSSEEVKRSIQAARERCKLDLREVEAIQSLTSEEKATLPLPELRRLINTRVRMSPTSKEQEADSGDEKMGRYSKQAGSESDDSSDCDQPSSKEPWSRIFEKDQEAHSDNTDEEESDSKQAGSENDDSNEGDQLPWQESGSKTFEKDQEEYSDSEQAGSEGSAIDSGQPSLQESGLKPFDEKYFSRPPKSPLEALEKDLLLRARYFCVLKRSHADFQQALDECKEESHTYRTALRPKLDAPPITEGLIVDPQVVSDAYELIRQYEAVSNGVNCYDLLFLIGFQSLLGAGSAVMGQIIVNCESHHRDRGLKLPENLNFRDGRPFFSNNGIGRMIIDYNCDLINNRLAFFAKKVHQKCRSYAQTPEESMTREERDGQSPYQEKTMGKNGS